MVSTRSSSARLLQRTYRSEKQLEALKDRLAALEQVATPRPKRVFVVRASQEKKPPTPRQTLLVFLGVWMACSVGMVWFLFMY
jgi:hypothetical protein